MITSAILIAAALCMAAYHEALQRGGGTRLSLVDFALSSMTVLYGALLGIFALGLLSRTRGSEASVITGAAVGAVSGLALFLHPLLLNGVRIAWPWWIPISASLTLAVAASRRTPMPTDPLSRASSEVYAPAGCTGDARNEEPRA